MYLAPNTVKTQTLIARQVCEQYVNQMGDPLPKESLKEPSDDHLLQKHTLERTSGAKTLDTNLHTWLTIQVVEMT